MPILDAVLATAQAECSDLPDVEQLTRLTLRMAMAMAKAKAMLTVLRT